MPKNVLRHMQGKQVGYQAVRQGTNPDYPTTNLWIASIANLKHTSVMANTWSTTPSKAKRKQHVGGNLIKIDCSEYMHYYYFGCHAVDNNNIDCQGQLSFEETFTPNPQPMGTASPWMDCCTCTDKFPPLIQHFQP